MGYSVNLSGGKQMGVLLSFVTADAFARSVTRGRRRKLAMALPSKMASGWDEGSGWHSLRVLLLQTESVGVAKGVLVGGGGVANSFRNSRIPRMNVSNRSAAGPTFSTRVSITVIVARKPRCSDSAASSSSARSVRAASAVVRSASRESISPCSSSC